jgi:hypothetical protein
LSRSAEEILRILGLPPARPLPEWLAVTNPGPRKLPEWATGKFAELFEQEAAVCLNLFAQARAQSDSDFECFVRSQRAQLFAPQQSDIAAH